MTLPAERIAVIGATGPIGIHLVRELVGRGREVLAVSRSRERLEELFSPDGIPVAAADALDGESTRRVVAGRDLVIDSIGLPPDRMDDHPRSARSIAEAAASAGARSLQISSYWSFFPQRREVVDEGHPRDGGHEWFQARRRAEDVMLTAGAAVVHLPDFFGPEVHTSSVQSALEEAAAGGPVNCLGPADLEREAAFVPDVARLVVELADREAAYGTDWALPGSGPLSAARLTAIASRHLGHPIRVRAVHGWLLRILSLFHPELRKIRPMIPQYVRPVRYDTAKLRRVLGELPTTPFEQAIPATLDWIVTSREGS